MLYPLLFTPILKQTLWGGERLAKQLRKPLQESPVGESWELSCRPEAMSHVRNGPLKGAPLNALIEEHREHLLGTAIWQAYGGAFPLLFKFIDATQRLSVQVHPDDAMARAQDEPFGKEEAWYVLDPGQGLLIAGLRPGTTPQECEEALRQQRVPDVLMELSVQPGEFIHIPPGTVHAVLEGVLLAEIQQNSNTTYRLYDWDRLGADGTARPLHTLQALSAMRYTDEPVVPFRGAQHRREGLTTRSGPTVGPHRVEHARLAGSCRCTSTTRSFSVLMVLEGGGELRHLAGSTLIQQGDTVLIPASLGVYRMEGELAMLRTMLL